MNEAVLAPEDVAARFALQGDQLIVNFVIGMAEHGPVQTRDRP